MKMRALVVTAAAAMLLAGCGSKGFSAALPAAPQSTFNAAATRTLLDSYRHIHLALFAKMDANSDSNIDEYEAGPDLDLRDFAKADKNKNGKLTKKEFMDYATDGGVFGFMRQNKNDFMNQARTALMKSFARLDKDKNLLLEREEMSNDALKKLGVNLSIDGLRVRAVISEFDSDVFEASDKTKDGNLSQAEWEDYCMNAVLGQINPNYTPGGAPAPAPSEEPAPGGEDL